MTLLLPRTFRNVAPHTYVVPVVRELPFSSSTPAVTGNSSSSVW